jgi:4-hydroxy-tetrahydrodipicolinate reductase
MEHGTALVIGTTGLEARHEKLMKQAANEIPIVYGRNMSIGVNVFMELVARAAQALDVEYDVEIVEAHHRHKVDAPSGTALALGERVAAARGRRSMSSRCMCAMAAPDRACRARSASRSCAAATSSATTRCCSSRRKSRSSSCTARRDRALSRAAR